MGVYHTCSNLPKLLLNFSLGEPLNNFSGGTTRARDPHAEGNACHGVAAVTIVHYKSVSSLDRVGVVAILGQGLGGGVTRRGVECPPLRMRRGGGVKITWDPVIPKQNTRRKIPHPPI